MSFLFCKQHAKIHVVPGIMARHQIDAKFALMCKCIVAVAFVPFDQICESLAALERNLPDLTFLSDWLEDNYLGKNICCESLLGNSIIKFFMHKANLFANRLLSIHTRYG